MLDRVLATNDPVNWGCNKEIKSSSFSGSVQIGRKGGRVKMSGKMAGRNIPANFFLLV